MPCRDGGPDPRDAEERADLRTRLDIATRLLCAVCRRLESGGRASIIAEFAAVKGLREWWQEHKAIDQARRVSEMRAKQRAEQKSEREKRDKKLAQEALSKLTTAERDAVLKYGKRK